MNKILNITTLLTAILVLLQVQALSQSHGVTWANILGSNGHENSPGFVVDSTGTYFVALTFEDSFIIPGRSDTLIPQGGYDGLVLICDNSGQVNNYWQLLSGGYISINQIFTTGENIYLTGGFQDTLSFKRDIDSQDTLLAITNANNNGYVIELTPSGEVINIILSDTLAAYSYYSKLSIADNNTLAALGVISEDSTEMKRNNIIYSTENSNTNYVLEPCNSQQIYDIVFFNEKLVFCGAFNDTIIFMQDTLLPKSNKDAFITVLDTEADTSLSIIYSSLQNASVRTMLVQDTVLWVGVNFQDSLAIFDTIALASQGANDFVILKYDQNLNLLNWYQFGGIYDERIDRLIANGQKMQILTNISSPITQVLRQDSVLLTIDLDNFWGNAALFSMDTIGAISFNWLIQQDWANKITFVDKINETETVISGLFDTQMTIDSIQYYTNGGQDVYLLQVSDSCLNGLKSTPKVIQFCEGDTIHIPNVSISKDNYLKVCDNDEHGIFITESCSFNLRIREKCGCVNTDSIVFEAVSPEENGDYDYWGLESKKITFFNDSIQLELQYLGDCSLNEEIITLIPRPNPFDSFAILDVSTTMEGQFTWQMFDINAKPICPITEQAVFPGSTSIELPVIALPTGAYMVKTEFKTEKTTHYESVIIVKK